MHSHGYATYYERQLYLLPHGTTQQFKILYEFAPRRSSVLGNCTKKTLLHSLPKRFFKIFYCKQFYLVRSTSIQSTLIRDNPLQTAVLEEGYCLGEHMHSFFQQRDTGFIHFGQGIAKLVSTSERSNKWVALIIPKRDNRGDRNIRALLGISTRAQPCGSQER